MTRTGGDHRKLTANLSVVDHRLKALSCRTQITPHNGSYSMNRAAVQVMQGDAKLSNVYGGLLTLLAVHLLELAKETG
jgi:hypothetical protein